MIQLSTTPIDPDKLLVEIMGGALGDTPVGIGTITRLAGDDPGQAKVAFSMTHGDHTTSGEVMVPALLWDHIRQMLESA